jgi:hypothetical protein
MPEVQKMKKETQKEIDGLLEKVKEQMGCEVRVTYEVAKGEYVGWRELLPYLLGEGKL